MPWWSAPATTTLGTGAVAMYRCWLLPACSGGTSTTGNMYEYGGWNVVQGSSIMDYGSTHRGSRTSTTSCARHVLVRSTAIVCQYMPTDVHVSYMLHGTWALQDMRNPECTAVNAPHRSRDMFNSFWSDIYSHVLSWQMRIRVVKNKIQVPNAQIKVRASIAITPYPKVPEQSAAPQKNFGHLVFHNTSQTARIAITSLVHIARPPAPRQSILQGHS